jgi:hypothetical protein
MMVNSQQDQNTQCSNLEVAEGEGDDVDEGVDG